MGLFSSWTSFSFLNLGLLYICLSSVCYILPLRMVATVCNFNAVTAIAENIAVSTYKTFFKVAMLT